MIRRDIGEVPAGHAAQRRYSQRADAAAEEFGSLVNRATAEGYIAQIAGQGQAKVARGIDAAVGFGGFLGEASGDGSADPTVACR